MVVAMSNGWGMIIEFIGEYCLFNLLAGKQ